MHADTLSKTLQRQTKSDFVGLWLKALLTIAIVPSADIPSIENSRIVRLEAGVSISSLESQGSLDFAGNSSKIESHQLLDRVLLAHADGQLACAFSFSVTIPIRIQHLCQNINELFLEGRSHNGRICILIGSEIHEAFHNGAPNRASIGTSRGDLQAKLRENNLVMNKGIPEKIGGEKVE